MITRSERRNGQADLTFSVPADQAPGGLSLVGDFNHWDPYAHPMRLMDDGTYQVRITVPKGQRICFRYLADGGVWFDDPDADFHDEHGGHLSCPAVPKADVTPVPAGHKA